MADVAMPDEVTGWMHARGWGEHHVQWHFERRWYFWHALAPSNPDVQAMVDEAQAKGWKPATLQEGAPGSGIEFLLMHRAMFHLLLREFPHHSHLLRGWTTPPQDPSDSDDPVPSGDAFDAKKAEGVEELESPSNVAFDDDDSWGRFLETNIRPTPNDPTDRSTDERLGIHNYLHGRWADPTSAVDLGNPRVNLLNRRFWRLHGWIDYQWWRFRTARGSSDDEREYRKLLEAYIQMMDAPHVHPHHVSPAANFDVEPDPFRVFFDF